MSSVLHYLDREKIQEALLSLYDSLDDSKTKWKQLRTYGDKEQVDVATRVCLTGVPAIHRLCYQTLDPNAPVEEVVLDIQGILVNHTLPPVNTKRTIPRKALFAQQMVVLSGYSTPRFSDFDKAVMFIDQKLQKSVKDGSYQSYLPTYVDGHLTIEASNPYFVPQSNKTHMTPLDFPQNVDPRGILSGAAHGLIHVEENVVQYYAKQDMIIGEEKITRFNTVDPSIFRPGQLVEIQVSFTIRKANNRHFKMFKVLRSVALLSDEHLSEAHVAYIASLHNPKHFQPCLKRRIGYIVEEEDEVVQTRQSMARMVISDMFEKENVME